MEKKKYDVEFHGTSFFALVPLLLFVVFCILFFVVFKTFDMMHLCMGGYVALIIGSLLSKNWGKYWDAVAVGMSSKIMNELALILLIVGMFGKLMTRGGVAQGFVWLGDMIGLSGTVDRKASINARVRSTEGSFFSTSVRGTPFLRDWTANRSPSIN